MLLPKFVKFQNFVKKVENLIELGKKASKNRKIWPQNTEFFDFAKSPPLQNNEMKDTIHFTVFEEGVTEFFSEFI
jgi:hypothetical protein